jgi:hypothetical protein
MKRIRRRTLASSVAVTVVVAGAAVAGVAAVRAGSASPPRTLALPAPAIQTRPPRSTTVDWATFTFRDANRASGFRCRLDGGAARSCTSPDTHRGLAVGAHTMTVQALDAAGQAGAGTSYQWHVVRSVTGFPIAGHLTGRLRAGGSARLDLGLSNPYRFPIVVTSLHVAPKSRTTKAGKPNPGCDGGKAIRVTQYTGGPLTIQPNETVTLASRGIDASRWPQLQLSADPDCAGASFAFAYTAAAGKP